MDFNRGWDEYRDGFNDKDRVNFWLGNEKVRQLTEDEVNTWEIRVAWNWGVTWNSIHGKGHLDNFRLLGANYTLHATGSIQMDGKQDLSDHISD